MTILSDRTITELMKRSQIVHGGSAASARHCAVEFKAARVVYGGIDPQTNQVRSIDLVAQPQSSAMIKPTAVVWVRSKEQVDIPADMVGIWMQTNSLSRRGLLLLNSTLVEPGYQGYLSAHFVNLGTSPVCIDSLTTIAKLVLVRLDQSARELVDSSKYGSYDGMLDGLAGQSSSSFLRIGELVPDLRNAADESVSEARRRVEALVETSLDGARKKLIAAEKSTFVRVGGGFVVGLLAAVTFALIVFPYLREIDNESKDRISTVVAESNAALREQLGQLQKDISEIKEKAKQPSAVQTVSPAVAPASNKTTQ